MKYCGKTMDGFADSFISLCKEKSLFQETMPDPDCLSFRSFAFNVEENMKHWFRPFLRWQDYMRILSDNLGVGDGLHAENAVEYKNMNSSVLVMLGEVNELEQRNVRSLFYSGSKSYYLCRKIEENKYFLMNTMGCPGQYISKQELMRIIDGTDGFVSWFDSDARLKIPSPEEIIRKAKRWKETCSGAYINDHKIEAQLLDKSKRILWFGVMNYQLQMNKTIQFFWNSGCIDRKAITKVDEKLMEISSRWETEGMPLLGSLEHELWDLL
jgi:hypothetical protein